MNPTPRLRFVERYIQINDDLVKVRVLQQWYAYDIQYPMTRGEWRDVPLEDK